MAEGEVKNISATAMVDNIMDEGELKHLSATGRLTKKWMTER